MNSMIGKSRENSSTLMKMIKQNNQKVEWMCPLLVGKMIRN